MQEHRQRHELLAHAARDQIGAARQLDDVELAPVHEAVMAGVAVHVGEERQLDAVRLDDAFLQRPDDLVVAAGDGELELLGHGSLALHNV